MDTLLRMEPRRTPVSVRLFACAVALTVTACEPAAPTQQRWSLAPSSEPLREDDEDYELGADDSVRWLEDGRLFVELVSSSDPYRHVARIWVAFDPGAPAWVEVQGWSEETTSNARWPQRDFVGQAWVSSDGTGLGQPQGPDLKIDLEYRSWQSGSDGPGGRRVHLRADQLERALGDARPPGAIDLTPSERSLLQVEVEPLGPGDTARRLADGRIFVERTRKRRSFDETLRLWIDDSTEGLPRVRAVLMKNWGNSRRPWTIGIVQGRSWVRAPVETAGDGADWIVELDLTVGGPISADRLTRSISIPAGSLAR